MSPETYLICFGGLATSLATSPETSQLLKMTNSLHYGLRRSLAPVARDLRANALQMILMAFGLTVVIAASAHALAVIIFVGVAYLVWIGLHLKLSRGGAATPLKATRRRLFQQGFMTSSANPYAVIIFTALFPPFIDPAVPVLPQLVIHGLTYLVVRGVILLLWGWATTRTLKQITSQGSVWLDTLSDEVMIAAAVLFGRKDLSGATQR